MNRRDVSHLRGIAGGVLSLIFFLPPTASAGLVTIANPSFESPQQDGAQPDSWTLVQGGGNVWNINDFPGGFWTVPAPDGKQVLSVIGPPFTQFGEPGIYRQTLSATFVADTVYTLSGQTGAPLGNGQYLISLLAGGNHVGSIYGTAPDNVFGPFSFQLDTRVRPDILGQPIGIELRSNTRYTAFDLIQLEAVFIPEPGTFVLVAVGLAALYVGRRRIAS